MIHGSLGRWAVRFLAAAGVTSVACSGHVDVNQGVVGSGGVNAHSGSSGTSNGAATSGGSKPVTSGGAETAGTAGESEPTDGGSLASGGNAGGEQSDPPSPDNPFPCLNPEPFGNGDSGLERCDNGMLRRVWVGSCDPNVTPADGCLVDEDCPPAATGGTICACDETGAGQCVPADCSTGSDCEAGFSCVSSGGGSYCATHPVVFGCQTPNDQCGTAATCAAIVAMGGIAGAGSSCVWDRVLNSGQGLQLTCGTCGVAGRPFLIDAFARTAHTDSRRDWLEPSVALAVTSLSDQIRVQLAAHWQHQAEMEHASVAAFARFILELLSLGAPPDLVSAATSALADETAHARLCYALASGYAGRALGPTKLDVTGALRDLGVEDIVTRAVLEGCIGETLAAIEASEAARHAADPALREVLSRIAEDEARHAELSWRFVRWALARGGSELRLAVRTTFRSARNAFASGEEGTRSEGELLQQGVLCPERRRRLALEVFETVIEPCVGALLVEPESAALELPRA